MMTTRRSASEFRVGDRVVILTSVAPGGAYPAAVVMEQSPADAMFERVSVRMADGSLRSFDPDDVAAWDAAEPLHPTEWPEVR